MAEGTYKHAIDGLSVNEMGKADLMRLDGWVSLIEAPPADVDDRFMAKDIAYRDLSPWSAAVARDKSGASRRTLSGLHARAIMLLRSLIDHMGYSTNDLFEQLQAEGSVVVPRKSIPAVSAKVRDEMPEFDVRVEYTLCLVKRQKGGGGDGTSEDEISAVEGEDGDSN